MADKTTIKLSDLKQRKVEIEGSLEDLDWVKILPAHSEGGYFKWWAEVKAKENTQKCIIWRDGNRVFISVKISPNHQRKQYYLN